MVTSQHSYKEREREMINLPGQTESLLFVSVDPNLSQWIVSVVKHRTAVTGHAAIKYTLVWYETVLDNVCSDGFVLTAPLGTQMAWTEPSDWLRADLRNSISVDKKISLRSISWRDRQIRRKAGSDRDVWFNTAGPTNKKSIFCLEQQWFFFLPKPDSLFGLTQHNTYINRHSIGLQVVVTCQTKLQCASKGGAEDAQ